VKKEQEFETLMNDLWTTAPVTVSSYCSGVNKPERHVAEIHFVVPGQKTRRTMDKEQIMKFLVLRYGGAQRVTTGVLEVMHRMETEKQRILAERKAVQDEMHARFEYARSLRDQFPDYDDIRLMEEILRLREQLADLAHASSE
jgi:hypothetical protein